MTASTSLADTPHIRLTNVEKEYRARAKHQPPVRAVDGISLDVARGSILGIVGYSGAGKSSLVRLINALEHPTGGSVVIDGQDITGLADTELRRVRSRIGMVFQHFNLFESRTVAGNVGYPLRVAGMPKGQAADRVAELLDFVGLGDKAKMHPAQLSGGQKQRVGIARALANQPDILLADEATSALDPETTSEVLGLLLEINRRFGTTIVVITHEMAVVSRICDQVAILDRGKVAEQGQTYAVFADPKATVTKRFIDTAVPGTPTGDTLARLLNGYTGTLAAVRITDDYTADTTGRLFQKHNVEYGLVHGGLAEVSGRPLGTLVFELQGARAHIAAALAELRAHTQAQLLGSAGHDGVPTQAGSSGAEPAVRNNRGGLAAGDHGLAGQNDSTAGGAL